jgi:methylmalonyl-CoA mutase N-terminal domain/subunit
MELEAEALFREIDKLGGVVRGIETGWFQQQIAQSARRFQHEVEQQRRIVVGVNEFVTGDELPVETLRIGSSVDEQQRRRLAELRARRDNERAQRCLAELHAAAARDDNVIPAMLDCARAYCTLYEIRHALEEVYGAYREPVFF